MAIDGKYGRVTTEFGDIGEDEPVVVFRAQDALLPKVLMYYHLFCAKADSPRRHLEIVMDAVDRVREWQANHHSKTPDSTGPAGQSYERRHPRAAGRS